MGQWGDIFYGEAFLFLHLLKYTVSMNRPKRSRESTCDAVRNETVAFDCEVTFVQDPVSL